jgi:ComF family protein
VCRSWSGARICPPCFSRFAPAVARCPRCALPGGGETCGECLRDPPPFERAVASVDYAWPWDGLIAAFKFRDKLDLAPSLARHLASVTRTSRAPRPGLVVPVPLTSQRLRERGYNQAWELARRIARELRVPADAALLERSGGAPHQLGLPRARRVANLRGGFAVRAACRDRLAGRDVALVDDVMTTGATAREAARALLDGGARSVQVWVAARTAAER